ncbi:MAG TPA: FAD-binding oxidoreductase, partial [Bacteroidales bacterium]|nr:FAD-binding oxidoreductase [Bacteroidales bacterium]
LRKARKLADINVSKLSSIVSEESPLIGIEPSAILAFRDEYPDLLRNEMKEKAKQLATNSLMFDEFIVREMEAGRIDNSVFTDQPKEILLHGHCQQKSVASTETTKKVLSLPVNYTVREIQSGCCGMAGSFGYEKEHYDLSMKVGELVLFPAVREAAENVIISAPGTSCRHQIKDGTKKEALHPVDVLFEALK